MHLFLNTMAKKKKIVYTSLQRFVSLGKGISVRDFSLLPNHDWVVRRIKEMSSSESSPAEEKFMDFCRAFRFNLFRQVYFNIDGKGYFLDFFLPFKNIAIEIDGRLHQEEDRKKYDIERDAAFLSIGIKTIRITTDEMNDPDFYEKYYVPRLSNIGYIIRPKSKISEHQKQLMRIKRMLEFMKPGETLEVQSVLTAVLYAISHQKPKRKSKDFPLLVEIYELRDKKRIKIHPRFIGKMENMKPKEKDWVERMNRKCKEDPYRQILVV